MTAMIKLRHQQPSLWHRGLAEDIEGLWEPWMRLVDELLEDEQLVDTVYEAQGERHPQSRSRGRMQTPAEVLLRLLLLKHIRNWSYDVLEREVRANLVYRAFTRIGDEKVPDAKTLARLGQLIEPKVIEELHRRVVELAQERGVTRGWKLRVDTTVVESNIHYPTDSSLLGDGTRVLTRTMKKIESKSGGLKRKVRDRMRSIGKRVVAILGGLRASASLGERSSKSGRLAAMARLRTACHVGGHELVGHAEQVPQYMLCDTRETNQHGTVADIVVGHIINIGSRCEQFGAVVEADANYKRIRSAERWVGTHAKSFPLTLSAAAPHAANLPAWTPPREMGSRRLHLTTADAKRQVQAISRLHPRAVTHPTESPSPAFSSHLI
jgi:IS5 family transposase